MTNPIDLRRVDDADVYKGDLLAGTLTRMGDEVHFRYLDEDRSHPGVDAVAWSLPTSTVEAVAHSGSVPPFFAGLLPEGVRLSGVVAGMKTSEDDHFSILLGVGADTMGDVRIVPEGPSPLPAPATFDPDVPTPDLRALVARLAGPQSIDVDASSLPGALWRGGQNAAVHRGPNPHRVQTVAGGTRAGVHGASGSLCRIGSTDEHQWPRALRVVPLCQHPSTHIEGDPPWPFTSSTTRSTSAALTSIPRRR